MRFIKYNPDSDMAKYLHTKPIANHLANIIATRARRTDCLFTGLKTGQCFLGDYKKIGLSEQQYRTAKSTLKRIGLATFQGTNKGTVATLVSIDVYNLNTEVSNGLAHTNPTKQQRLTKNEKNKELKNKDIVEQFLKVVEYFKLITGQKLRVDKVYSKLVNSEKYKKIVSRLNAGITVDECKAVIELKHNQWKDDAHMKHHVCISTIFRPSNFEKYLDELNNQGEQPANSDTKPTQKDLETYILQYHRQKDLDHMKKGTQFDRWLSLLNENWFKLNNVAKTYKNKSFTTLFLFEACHMPLSNRLNGSKPDRKLEALQRWYAKLSDYNQNQGDMRTLLKSFNKQAA